MNEDQESGARDVEEATQMHHELSIMPDNPRDSFSNKRARESRDAKGDSSEYSIHDAGSETSNTEG